MVLCKCVFLDGKEVFLTVEKDATGSDLYDSICEYLGIQYRDPFGIAFRGGAAPAPYNWWVRMDKTLIGQIPGKCKIWEFAFLVKYYPKKLTGMEDVMARHHVILQIRQDLLTGTLKCPVQTMSHLCSYWLQAEYGDWSSRHIDMQLADAFRFVQKGIASSNADEDRSDLNFEEQMMQMHQAHRGMSTNDAEYRFIRLAASLPNYGIHYYPTVMFMQPTQQKARRRSSILSSAKNEDTMKSEKITIGVGPLGVHQFRRKGNEIVFTWKAMRAVGFVKNKVVLKMQGALRKTDQDNSDDDAASKKNITKEYEFADMFQTKIVWQVMIEYHMFFRVGDLKGLKGNQRKQLLNSLKTKRAIPMVGEKKIEAQTNSPNKTTPKSQRKARFDLFDKTSKKRASSLPPSSRLNNGERRMSSTPRSTRKCNDDNASLKPSERLGFEVNTVGASSKPELEPSTNSPNPKATEPQARSHDDVRGLTSPFTPMSGNFTFPQWSIRGRRSSSVGRQSREDTQTLDGQSVASDDTDELCKPDALRTVYSNPDGHNVGMFDDGDFDESISPRSQSTARSAVPKLQLNSVRSKDDTREVDASPGNLEEDGGPFVIPAEILIADLRECRKTKEGEKRDAQIDPFPIELDFQSQHSGSRYLNDANSVADQGLLKPTDMSYLARRTRSLTSLRPKPPRRTEYSSSTERRLVPSAQSHATLPKSTKDDVNAKTQPQMRSSRRARSETKLPQHSRNRDGPQLSRSSDRDVQSARPFSREEQPATLPGYVALLSEVPTVKPRKSKSSLKREMEVPSDNGHKKEPPTLIKPHPEVELHRTRGRSEGNNTIPKIPTFIRSVV